MNDFGKIDPLDLVKHTESSTNHNTSGWMDESKGKTSANNEGSVITSKGTLDLALENLQTLYAGAWGVVAGFAAVHPVRLLVK
jgi:hypothetical protein